MDDDDLIFEIASILMIEDPDTDELIIKHLTPRYDAMDAHDIIEAMHEVLKNRTTKIAECLVDKDDIFLIRLFACLTFGMFVQLREYGASDRAFDHINVLWKKITKNVELIRMTRGMSLS